MEQTVSYAPKLLSRNIITSVRGYINVTKFLREDLFKYLGLVAQSIVSLTSSLRGQLVKCLTTSKPYTLIVFEEKMKEAFALALQKLLTFFQQKNIAVFQIFTFEILTKR